MIKEFRAFIARGNVIDLAVALIIGAAFGKIITSFVNDILMPLIGLLFGGVNFTDLFITLKGPATATLAAAKEAGAVTWNYGAFLQSIVDFLIVAAAIFFVIKAINRFHKEPAPPDPSTKECPYCATVIPLKASRCPSCTSQLTI